MKYLSAKAVEELAPLRPPGYVEEVLFASVRVGDILEISDEKYDALFLKYNGRQPPCGVGCQIARLLKWFLITGSPSCNCMAAARLFDAWGPDECAEREEEILDHLAEAAGKRGLPFVRAAARLLLHQAIAAARRDAAPAPSGPAGG